MGLPIAAWFTGDDGPPMSDRPRELPTPPRTLPVTPAERACATVLRAYLAWNIDEANDPEGTFEWWSMVKLGEYLETRGFVEPSGHDPSQVGRALLARVEAEERTPETVLRAMLASYEAAALDAAREWSRTASEDMWGPISVHDMAGAISLIRLALAWLLESRPDPIGRFFSRALAADYAARLAGTTPIAAPPAKEPR